MEHKEMKELVCAAVSETIDAKLGDFFIDREKHYQHHLFLEEWISWTRDIKSTALRTLAKTFVTACVFFLVLGFCVWWGIKH